MVVGEHTGGELDDQFVMDPSLRAMYGGALFFNSFSASYTRAADEKIVQDYVRKQM